MLFICVSHPNATQTKGEGPLFQCEFGASHPIISLLFPLNSFQKLLSIEPPHFHTLWGDHYALRKYLFDF